MRVDVRFMQDPFWSGSVVEWGAGAPVRDRPPGREHPGNTNPRALAEGHGDGSGPRTGPAPSREPRRDSGLTIPGGHSDFSPKRVTAAGQCRSRTGFPRWGPCDSGVGRRAADGRANRIRRDRATVNAAPVTSTRRAAGRPVAYRQRWAYWRGDPRPTSIWLRSARTSSGPTPRPPEARPAAPPAGRPSRRAQRMAGRRAGPLPAAPAQAGRAAPCVGGASADTAADRRRPRRRAVELDVPDRHRRRRSPRGRRRGRRRGRQRHATCWSSPTPTTPPRRRVLVSILTGAEPVALLPRGAAAVDTAAWIARATDLRDARRSALPARHDANALLAALGAVRPRRDGRRWCCAPPPGGRRGSRRHGRGGRRPAVPRRPAAGGAVVAGRRPRRRPGRTARWSDELGVHPLLDLGTTSGDGIAGLLTVPCCTPRPPGRRADERPLRSDHVPAWAKPAPSGTRPSDERRAPGRAGRRSPGRSGWPRPGAGGCSSSASSCTSLAQIFVRIELVAFSFVLALFFTAVLHPLERLFSRMPGPRSLSAGLALLIGLLVLAGIATFVTWQINDPRRPARRPDLQLWSRARATGCAPARCT